MEERDNISSVFHKIINNIDENKWPEFMRRLGCSYKRQTNDKDKYRMLHSWKTEMDKVQSWSESETILFLIRKETYENEQEIDTTKWNSEMKNNRETALLFYGIMRRYYDEDFWKGTIVRKKLELPEDAMCQIELDNCSNSNEKKYNTLDYWRRWKLIDNVGEIKVKLNELDIISDRFLSVSSVSRFEKPLREIAEKQTNIDLPIDLKRAINAVTLQILKKTAALPNYLDSVGQFNKRSEMKAVYDTPRGDITIKELFSLAKSNADTASQSVSPDSAKKEYILKQSNNILVTGQAGIGKTTLTKMLVKLLLENEIPEVRAKYIIYIKIRTINFDTPCDLTQFLEDFGGFHFTYSNDDIDKLTIKDVQSLCRSSQVAMIFDGVDEANTPNLKEEPPLWNPERVVCPSIIIRNLMQGNVFPNAKKLWTSRQRQAYELHKEVRPDTIVQILGLDQQAQEELGKQLCTAEGWPQVKNYLEDHPDLQVICYVPVICIIAISSIHSSLVLQEDDVELHTMTDVLAYALDLYSRSDHLRGHEEEISKIPTLAFDSFVEEKIIFDEKDLSDAGIHEKAFEAFLVTAVDKRTNFRLKLVVGDKKSSFSHLIWHEMFTAIKGVMYTKRHELNDYLPKMLEARWEVVAKLMYGLTHLSTLKRLQTILHGWSENNILDNRQELKDFALTQVKAYRSHDSNHPEEKTQKLIQICSWIRETNSRDFTELVRKELPDIVDISGELLPSDIRCITYVLPDRHAIRIGVGAAAHFIANSLPLLCSEIQRKQLKVKQFNLEGNDLNKIVKPLQFSKCLCYVHDLSLLRCRVNDGFLKATCEEIRKRNTLMENFDLSHNQISIKGATYLAQCLNKVASLNIDSCDFDAVKFEVMADYLQKTSHALKLHVGYTDIDNRAAKALCRCLCNISSMAYARCGVLDQGFMQFIATIQQLEHPMDEIILSTNISAKNDLSKMSDDDKACAVASCLRKVKRLKLNCWIKQNGAQYLVEELNKLSTPMELLDVSGNKFGDNGAFAFTTCLNKVKKLVMENCAVTKEGFLRFKRAYETRPEEVSTVVFGNIEGITETILEPPTL